ncbi:hypothetical protein D5S17_35630 [Pseudonocardiaceae bacterium YIM PH 21723]|nr:hypothetical protein D5S17_35630 [Pseudonocardiaceae bacterium YIM PH 21723]
MTSREQASTDPADTRHLHAGDRITMGEFAAHLDAAGVWLRQLAVAGERPDVPVELEDMLARIDRLAQDLKEMAGTAAEVDNTITDERPLAPGFRDEPWGAAAFGADPDRTRYGKTLSTVLTYRQILSLARSDTPWAAEQARPGISYLAGLEGLPDLDRWESKRGTARRAAERESRITAQVLRESCDSCGAAAGKNCSTRTGRLTEAAHQPRRKAAVATIEAQEAAGTPE